MVYSGASTNPRLRRCVFLENVKPVLFSQTSTQALRFEHLKPRKRGTFRRPPSHTRDDGSSPRREHKRDGKWEDGQLLQPSLNAGEAAAAASREGDKGHFRHISGLSQHYLASYWCLRFGTRMSWASGHQRRQGRLRFRQCCVRAMLWYLTTPALETE